MCDFGGLHRRDTGRAHVGGEHDMGVECFTYQLVFDVLVLGGVPQIIKLPWVIHQVIKFADVFVVIHT